MLKVAIKLSFIITSKAFVSLSLLKIQINVITTLNVLCRYTIVYCYNKIELYLFCLIFSCVSEKLLLVSVFKTLESCKAETEKLEFILRYSPFWLLIIRDNNFNNDRTVSLAKSLLNSFSEKVYTSTITLKEFCDSKTFFTESTQSKENLLQVVSEKRGFSEHWQKLAEARKQSQAKYKQLKSLCENFLYKLSDDLSIKDIDVIEKELIEAKDKLDNSSSSKMGEFNKPGFFKQLDDLIEYAESLQPLRGLDGFLVLCRHHVSELGISEGDAGESTEDEINCSSLFVAEEDATYESCSLTAVDVAKYIAGECIKQYIDWLHQATSDTSTLGCMLKYGDYEEMKYACKHFKIHISSKVWSAFKWLNDLESNKQKVISIRGTMEVLGLKVKGTEMGNTVETFLKCVTHKQAVTISDFSHVMQALQNFLSETDEELWAVFEELSKATQLVQFLQESLEDDFRNLIDAVEERSEQTLDETTVSDLIKVKEFLQPILRKKAWGTPEELFRTIKKCIEKAGTDVSKKINNCFYHRHGLKALYQYVANRGELTKDMIASAMTRGTYLWTLDESSLCTVSLIYKKLKSNEKLRLSSEELNDLRSRALLLSNSEKRMHDKKGQDRAELQKFVGVVDIINEVSCTVTELHQLGHFSYKIFSCKMQSSKILELPQIVNTLKQELDDWKSVLNASRQQHLSLNFLHSDQLSLIHNFLLGKCDSEQQVENVLNFVCPGASIAQLRQFQQTGNKNISTTQEKLTSIGLALDAVKTETYFRRRNFLNDKKFKNSSQDVNAVVQPGTLYIAHFETDSAQTIPILLSLYANTKGYFPVPSEVLFCHKQTSWEEIQLIIQRSVLSAEANEVSELHCICNVELLPGNLQSQLVNALGDLLQNCSSNYSLAVICQGGIHHPIIDHFSSFLHHLQGFDTALLQFCLQTIWPEVTMITSNVPGLGKTEYIRNLACERGCQTKTVHISGPVSRDSLVTRLQKLNIQQCDLLHVNIGEVEDPKFVDACLFQYIVLGCLHSGTKLVCLPTSNVAIEIANTVEDRLKDSLVILSSFKLKNIQWENYDNFLVSGEVCSPVQIVCNYLKSFDEGTLDSRDLVFSGEQRVEALPPATCRQLLAQHFSAAADLSFAVIETFLNVLSDQLMKLSNSQFFYVKSLQAMLGEEHPNDVKSKLVKAFLETAKGFASRSVQSCRSMQHFAQTKVFAPSDNQNKETQEVPQKLDFEDLVKERMKNMVRWSDTNHLLVTFNGNDCQTVSALYRDLHEVPKYIKKLFTSQLQKDLPNFEHLSEEQLKVILNRVTGSTLQKVKSGETDVYYAVTPDNLLKMVLVFLRVRANVPVVIMGETGCGKTSLIRYLAQTYGTEFKHVSIHAGTTVEEISKTVFDCVNECLGNRSTELWMFLDEVNTCEHLGLLSEMICHHSYLGKMLPKNLVVLAACNPYRLRKPGKILTAGLDGKVKMDEFSRFVYRVHPLPEAMIDYVWDYGTLHRSDEESYIRQMVINIFPKAIRLKEKIANLLIASQDFTRTTEGNDWCVSLRDVYRCQMLMTQFLKMLQNKLKHVIKDSKPNYSKTDLKVHSCAIALALAHCYQSRLADNTTREKYWQVCSKIMFDSEQKYKELVEMVRFEQLDLLRRMELPQGIAMNTALCENVFVILTCILNRIPIFLVGKPGCSKSLSVQLIKSNLRGKDSVDSYFQTLPNLYVVSYQGSESSTSEGIEKVFQKAEKYGENSKQEGVLPVVLLDEIGLAEVSKFNPLKVLHKLLEPATGQLPNVAVVGISNWCLDAAKMNRAIHLSRPDMDIEELFETGKAISRTDSSASSLCSDETLKALAEAYDKYKRKQRIQNFHGLRDYYALIKYVSRHMSKKQSSCDDKTDEVTVIQKGFQRNFGGLESGPSEISELFLSSVKKNSDLIWNVEEIITENLGDELARHLMLVTSGDSALGILVRCLEKLERKYVVMFGSKFEEDQTEEYSYRILNRIILCMETGNILILKDLDTIYGSLYDMLNQNYTIVGKKKNCRIALGPHSNPMCHVHDDFRCIVLVDEEKLNLSDPPFLNRFEKQVLRFDDIIDEKQRGLINELEEWVHDFSLISDKPVFGKQDAFLGMNVDTISSAVYQITKEQQNWDNSDKFDECRDAILWLVPPDAMLRVSDSELSIKSPTEVKHIQTCYFKRPIHQGFSHFLTLLEEKSSDNIPPRFSETPGIRLVIYTHSNIYVDLHKALEKHKPIQVEKLGNFKSEKQFTTHMRQFFESENRFLILQCEPNENGQHLPLAKFQLEELHREYATKTCKNICIILHISRIASSANPSSQWQFSFLSGWQLVVIDSLEQQEDFPLTKTLSMTVADLLQTGFRPIKHCIRENLVWAFTCTSSSYRERSMEEFSQLIVQITNSDSLVSCLAECLQKHIEKEHKELNDCIDITNQTRWQVKVAFDNRLLRSATSFTDALKQYLTECVTIPLANFVHQLEKLSAWHSYFSKETEAIWVDMFKTPDIFSLSNVQVPQGPGSFKIHHKPLKLQYPFSQIFIEKCLKHEVFFKEELSVEMASSNSYKLSTARFDRYKELLEEDLKTVIEAENLGNHESKLISDICIYLSLAYSLDEEDRVEIGLWLISFKAPSCDHMQQMNSFTTSLLCLWQHESLFHSLLQLFSECQILLPCSIKKLLTAISSRKQKSESLEEKTCQEKDPRCDDLLQQDDVLVQLFSSMEDGFKSEDAVTFLDNQSNPIQEAGENCSTILQEIGTNEEVMSDYSGDTRMATQSQDEIEHESNIHTYGSELETGASHSGHSSEVEATTDVFGSSQKLLALIGVDDEEFLALHPEERLVHLMCRLLIPTKQVLDECHGVSGWHGRVCSVLSFCSSVSSYPVSLHALRIFNDLATVLFHCKLESKIAEQFLMKLADGIELENLEKSLDSMQMFEKVMKLMVNLHEEDVPVEQIQSFVTLCIGRIMYINPDTELLRAFLEKAATMDLIDKNLSHLQPLLHRVLLEAAGDPNELFKCFEGHIREEGNESVEQYPQIVAIGDALAKVDIKNPVFLVLCIDVIQNIVMEVHAWEQLEHVQSTSDCHLITFEASIKVIAQSQDVGLSLRLAAAVAYVKEFLHQLKEMIVFDMHENRLTDHNFLYQNINSLFSSSNPVIVEYLLKELKMNRSFGQVREVLTKVETVIPLPAKVSVPDDDLSLSLGYKLLGRSTERNIDLEKALLNLDKDDKPVHEYLNKKQAQELKILGFFEALLHTAYLPASLRQLTHSEKRIGAWITEQSLQISSNELALLLQKRLTNEESFSVDLFRLLPGSTHLQLQKTAFLLHLVSLLVAKTQEQQGGCNLFIECLIHPEIILNENVLSKISCVESSSNTSSSANLSLVTCKCWTQVIFLESQCLSCPVCEISWTTGAVQKYRSVEHLDMLTVTETADKEMTGKNILKLMITASLLGSLALDILKPDSTEGSKTSDCKDMLINQFEVTWNALEVSLQLKAEDLSLFLQNIIDKMDLFPKNYQKFEKDIGGLLTVVVKHFLAPSFYNDIKHYHSCVSTVKEEIKHAVLELPSQDSDKSLNSLRHLFRISKHRTPEDLRARFYINKKEKTHLVLDLSFKKCHSLILLGHLIPLVKWSQLCYQATNHRFTRAECKKLTLSQLRSPEGQEANFEKHYDTFMASWKELWKKENLSILKRFDSSLPDQPQTGAVVICENSESVLYKVLKVLVNIQNMFLEELLAIAQSGKCPSLGFLKKNFTDMAAIKCVLVQNFKENQVIPWNFHSLLETQTKFGQNSSVFGNGNQVCYNFVKIEMEIANSLCLGKAYIIINDTFSFVTYANELFVSCASVLREFRTIIPQKDLAHSVKDGIENKMKADPDFAKQVMKQTEILLCLVKKTGGSPDQTLTTYVQTWLRNLSSGFQDGVLRPFGHEPMRLSHLVALYEFLENIQADVEIETLHEGFKATLPPAAREELKEFINKSHFPIKLIQAAFRKFIMRYVRNFDPEQMNLNSPLVDWMAEPTFWPEELEMTGAEEKFTTVKNEFPQILNLKHTFHALECIKAMIKVSVFQVFTITINR